MAVSIKDAVEKVLVGLEEGILEYICGMLEEAGELLDSAEDLAEAIGPFLESSGFVEDADTQALPYCEKIVALMSKGSKAAKKGGAKGAKKAKAPRAKPAYSKGTKGAKAGGAKAKKGGAKGKKGAAEEEAAAAVAAAADDAAAADEARRSSSIAAARCPLRSSTRLRCSASLPIASNSWVW